MEEEKPAKPVFNSKTQLGTWQQELWNAVEELPDGPAKEKLAKLMKTGPARKKAVLGRRGWQADLARRMVIGLHRLSDVEAIRPLTGPWSGLPCSVRCPRRSQCQCYWWSFCNGNLVANISMPRFAQEIRPYDRGFLRDNDGLQNPLT